VAPQSGERQGDERHSGERQGDERQSSERQSSERSSGETTEFMLQHGDLLVMSGDLQHFYHHSVPKQVGLDSERINLTFRFVRH
jgi:hypothetical protein